MYIGGGFRRRNPPRLASAADGNPRHDQRRRYSESLRGAMPPPGSMRSGAAAAGRAASPHVLHVSNAERTVRVYRQSGRCGGDFACGSRERMCSVRQLVRKVRMSGVAQVASGTEVKVACI